MKRNNKRKRILALLLFGALLVTTACSPASGSEAEKEDDGKIEIGITFDTFILERWQRDRDVFVSAAEELGATVNVQNANGDIDEQINQIDYFIQKGMDAIVVIQVSDDEKTLRGAITRAHNAGIPVISYDRLVLDANVDLYISFDNEKVGKLMAEHMLSHLGTTANIVQICGPLSDNNVSMIMDGFEAATEDSGFSILETDFCTGWISEYAFEYASDYLDNNPAPDGFMCGNDALAGNVIKALSEAQLAGDVCVVGQDADLDACQRIVEGTQCMTVYKPIEKLARRAAELSVALAEGKRILSVTNRINDGTYDVPYETITPVAVTAENMDEVITGNYHEEEDIYLNVRKTDKETEN